MKKSLYAFVLIAVCTLGALSAQAANTPKLIGTHNSWKAYSFVDKGEKVCFMSSQPQKQKGKFKKRGEVFFFITHWSGDKEKNVVSISNGYAFKPDSQVTVKIDGKSFQLFTQGEMAWTKDQSVDDALTAALQKGSSLTVSGLSKFGTETTDTYNLKGSGDAYQTVTKECSNTPQVQK